jgi:hypothetical protein
LDDFFSELDGIRSGDTTAPSKANLNDAQRSSASPAAADFDFDDLGDFAKIGTAAPSQPPSTTPIDDLDNFFDELTKK